MRTACFAVFVAMEGVSAPVARRCRSSNPVKVEARSRNGPVVGFDCPGKAGDKASSDLQHSLAVPNGRPTNDGAARRLCGRRRVKPPAKYRRAKCLGGRQRRTECSAMPNARTVRCWQLRFGDAAHLWRAARALRREWIVSGRLGATRIFPASLSLLRWESVGNKGKASNQSSLRTGGFEFTHAGM